MTLPHSRHFSALGTEWKLETEHVIADNLFHRMMDRIEIYDQTYSRFRDDSLVAEISHTPGTYTFPGDVVAMIDFYKTLYDLTGGAVTPLIGNMLETAGYDAEYSLDTGQQSALPSWDDVLKWDGQQLTTLQSVTLDFGAAGKGYLVDILATMLQATGINEYVIDASGDLIHKGSSENRVGLEHPLDTQKIIGVIDVQNKSLCASAINRRAWGDGLHHIFNPHTKAPVRDIIATWVVAQDALIADGLATALFFTKPEVLAAVYEFGYVRMFHDGSLDYSQDFNGELF
jgi:thiamine biosynthesis lipoprotein